jgi:uncharacterized protein
LDKLIPFIVNTYVKNEPIELNILTDRLDLKSMCDCGAGVNSLALAPNGRIYICPAFYFNNENDYVGTLDDAVNIKNGHLLKLENAPVCSKCDAYNCLRCKFKNQKLTNEIHIPSGIQCRLSHLERSKAAVLQEKLLELKLTDSSNLIRELPYNDPIEQFVKAY